MAVAYMTEDGYNKLKEELAELESVQRQIGRASCRERV